MYCTFFLVRHAETDWNKNKIIQGHTDIPLNKTGLRQARDLKEKLSYFKFDAAFSSDLLRAKQTAEIIILEQKLAVQTTKTLRERRFGKFEGTDSTKFWKIYEALQEKANQNHSILRAENLESDEEVATRLTTFLREIAVASPNKKILVLSHGGVMRVFLGHLKGKKIPKVSISNTAYLKIDCDGVDFFIKSTYGIKEQ